MGTTAITAINRYIFNSSLANLYLKEKSDFAFISELSLQFFRRVFDTRGIVLQVFEITLFFWNVLCAEGVQMN